MVTADSLRFWVVTYREKGGGMIVANRGRVYTAIEDARRGFEGFIMHTGCESVTLWECPGMQLAVRVNGEKSPKCKQCGSVQTEYYGQQLHCFACGAVYSYANG